jgi:hypothetical protein
MPASTLQLASILLNRLPILLLQGIYGDEATGKLYYGPQDQIRDWDLRNLKTMQLPHARQAAAQCKVQTVQPQLETCPKLCTLLKRASGQLTHFQICRNKLDIVVSFYRTSTVLYCREA